MNQNFQEKQRIAITTRAPTKPRVFLIPHNSQIQSGKKQNKTHKIPTIKKTSLKPDSISLPISERVFAGKFVVKNADKKAIADKIVFLRKVNFILEILFEELSYAPRFCFSRSKERSLGQRGVL